MSTAICLVIVGLLEIGSVKAVVFLGAYMNFCPYFPYLLSDLNGIWHKKSAHNTLEHFWVL
jgi:hypothetical protein